MIPNVSGRPATRKRWPEGVDRVSFFVKDLEPGTPGWLTRVQIGHRSGPKFLSGHRFPRRAGLARSSRRVGAARSAVADRGAQQPHGRNDAALRGERGRRTR
jgi:hypothetical protein